MNRYRNRLPQLESDLFLTDGGLETTLVFHQGIDLPGFAAFALLENEQGKETLRNYYRDYLELAKTFKTNFILESATWRSNTDWGNKLGYSQQQLDAINALAIGEMETLRDDFDSGITHIVISGNIGPRGDGYRPTHLMTPQESERYHAAQISVFAKSNADLVTAVTLNYSDEAVGIVHAAKKYNIPAVISFTVETDGKLASGETLDEAIDKVETASNGYTSYYMINCAHPNYFIATLGNNQNVLNKIHGVRANASLKSHAELDESTELDAGDKQLLTARYKELKNRLAHFTVIGGCCGTDHTHIREICNAWFDE